MKGYLYILEDSIRGIYYIGSTNNLERRIYQHKHGHTQTTARMKEHKIVFTQEFDSLEMARKLELKLKKLRRKDYIAKIVKDGYLKMGV